MPMSRAAHFIGQIFFNILKKIHLFIFMKRSIARKDNFRRANVYQIDRHGDDLSSDCTAIFAGKKEPADFRPTGLSGNDIGTGANSNQLCGLIF
jgi:hypothetical protein